MDLSHQINEQAISNIVQVPWKGLISDMEQGCTTCQPFLEREEVSLFSQTSLSTSMHSSLSVWSHHLFYTHMIGKLVLDTWSPRSSFGYMKLPMSLTLRTKQTNKAAFLSSCDVLMDYLCTPCGFSFIPNIHVNICICFNITEIEASSFLVLLKHHFFG